MGYRAAHRKKQSWSAVQIDFGPRKRLKTEAGHGLFLASRKRHG
jgi:hypothetical protein